MSVELESLDDIIKKKKIGNPLKKQGMIKKRPAGPGNKQIGPNKRTGLGIQSGGIRRPGPIIKGNLRTNGIVAKGPKRMVEDARTRIIQKTKMKVRDAREKLTNSRTAVDARSKLRNSNMNMMGGRPGRDSGMGRRNPRMSLSSGRFPSRTMDSMNMGSGRPTTFRAVIPRSTRYMDPQILGGYSNDYIPSQGSLRRSVVNDSYGGFQSPASMFSVKQAPYFDWDNPANAPPRSSRITDLDRPRDYKILSSSGMSKPDHYRDDYYSSKPVSRTAFLSDDYYAVKPSLASRSRIESPPKPSRANIHTSPRLKPSSSSPSSSQGYRIVVSNLQSNVTQEDIKELFEDIGELVVSRLVRPGIAEVVYKSLKDATKAVETYHNRQLDGHPMKCLLVNPKTKSSASSARSVLAGTRSNYSHQPSLGTVHRALFD